MAVFQSSTKSINVTMNPYKPIVTSSSVGNEINFTIPHHHRCCGITSNTFSCEIPKVTTSTKTQFSSSNLHVFLNRELECGWKALYLLRNCTIKLNSSYDGQLIYGPNNVLYVNLSLEYYNIYFLSFRKRS